VSSGGLTASSTLSPIRHPSEEIQGIRMSTAQTGTSQAGSSTTEVGIDPRGPQFNAIVTLAVLVVILATLGSTFAAVLTAIQTGLFIWGATAGVAKTPHAWVFKRVIRPRLTAPTHLEDAAPPRFAQGVGAAFLVVALLAQIADATTVAAIALGLATVAATLNAVFRFCLGCEMYLVLKRLTPA
jgi:hypothetical protein